jgi:glycosyltransferase involved in cell wall biosynthesis
MHALSKNSPLKKVSGKRDSAWVSVSSQVSLKSATPTWLKDGRRAGRLHSVLRLYTSNYKAGLRSGLQAPSIPNDFPATNTFQQTSDKPEFFLLPPTLGKISFVVPTYERANEATDAVLSIYELNLAPSQFEVIVLDNASSDETHEVFQYLGSRLSNLIFRQSSKNLGAIENWRKGIEIASYDWVKIIYSDDELLDGFFAALHHFDDWTDAAGLVAGAVVQNRGGRYKRRYCDLGGIEELTSQSVIAHLLQLPARIPVSPSAGFGRRANYLAALQLPYPDDLLSSAMGPDLVMNYLPVFQGQKVYHYPRPTVRLRGGHDSITMNTKRFTRYARYAAALLLLCEYTQVLLTPQQSRQIYSRIELTKQPSTYLPKVSRAPAMTLSANLRRGRVVFDGVFYRTWDKLRAKAG